MGTSDKEKELFKNWLLPCKRAGRKLALRGWGFFGGPEICFCQHRKNHRVAKEEMKTKVEVKHFFFFSRWPGVMIKMLNCFFKRFFHQKNVRATPLPPTCSLLSKYLQENIKWNIYLYTFFLRGLVNNLISFICKFYQCFHQFLWRWPVIPLFLWTKNKLGFFALRNTRLTKSMDFKIVLIIHLGKAYWKNSV